MRKATTNWQIKFTTLFVILTLIAANSQFVANATAMQHSQLPSDLPIITAANVHQLTEVTRLCDVNADDCGAPLQWSPDSKQLAVGSIDSVDIFDIRHPNQASKHIPVLKRRFEQFSPDWSLLATINENWSASIWDVKSAQKEFTLPLPGLNVGWLEFSPDGQFLALFTNDYRVRLWNVKANQQVHAWAGYLSNDPAWSFSPDGATFAVNTFPTPQSQAIQLWDLRKNQITVNLTIDDFEPIISQIAFSPDGRMLVVSSIMNTTVWDIPTRTKLFTPEMTFKFDWALASIFSPDSKILASMGRQRIYLWNLSTHKQIARIDGLGLDGVGAQFGKDTSLLVTTDWSDDNSLPYVRLWNAADGAKLSDFVNEQSPVLSPDGTMLATNEYDGSVIIRAVTH